MASTREKRELYEAKQRAVKYYNENGVPKKIEEIMNSMFYDNPADVYVQVFQTLAKPPTVSKITARQAYDSKGQPTVQTEVHGTVKNEDKLLYTHVSSTTNSSLLDNVRVEEREVDDQQRQENISAAINILNSDINNRIHATDPTQQDEVDRVIMKLYEELKVIEDERLAKEAEEMIKDDGESSHREDDKASVASGKKGKNSAKKGKSQAAVYVPDEPKEKLLCGSNAFTAISQATCCAAAQVKHVDIYEHVACLRHGEIPEKFSVPLPMVTIIQSGRAAPGKLNCVKEFMVIPKHDMPLKKSMTYIQQIYNYVAKQFFAKGGTATKLVNDIGAMCPTFDKAEQGLDLLQEAITNCGLTAGEDFFIGLNCAGPEMFDYDPVPMAGKSDKVANFPGQDMHKVVTGKGKYEVMVGIAKVADDLEEEHWMRLCDRISDRCLVIGSQAYHRPGLLKDEQLTENFKSSGIAFKLEQLNTVSDILTCVKKMEVGSAYSLNNAFSSVILVAIAFVVVPPGFAVDLVKDRQYKIRSQLRTAGVPFSVYWLSNFFIDVCKFCIPAVFCIILTAAIQVDSLKPGGAMVSLVLLFLTIIPSSTLFVYIFQFLFDNFETCQSSLTVLYFFISFLPYLAVSLVDMISGEIPARIMHYIFVMLLPPYKVFGGIYYIDRIYRTSLLGNGQDITFGEYFKWESNILLPILWPLVEIPLYIMLLRIIDVRKTGGEIQDALPCISKKNSNEVDTENSDIIEDEDEDVAEERQRVKALQTRERNQYPVVMVENLRKEFAKRGKQKRKGCKKVQGEEKVKVVVRNTSFAVESGEVLGLLGPNGAGKTTTLNMVIAELDQPRERFM
ncbi:ENO [Mytilus edulis]|uniref:Enolase 4 n=1 Tax=Mytilus edulis TaxID=6550 RepID=A0A8S3U530_MYTED|nr:ENO [Mytilus edulis]